MILTNKNKRYNTLTNYYKYKYNSKVIKISLNGGFTCPNIDGSVGRGGCSFCSISGSGEFTGKKGDSLLKQFEEGKKLMHKKWQNGLYIAYFQSFSNTYAPVEYLRELYTNAINLDPNIVCLSIGTRPDCLNDDIIDLLDELSKKVDIQVELGLQTIHQKTAKDINRCHSLEVFDESVKKLKEKNIEVIAHIINGLPGETKDMMLDTVKHLNNLPIDGIKIHMLNILKDSFMGYMYKRNPWDLLTRDEYVDIVVEQILNLRDDIIIHRLTGDGMFDMLLAPEWIKKKFVVMNEIDKKLRKLDMYQGQYLKK